MPGPRLEGYTAVAVQDVEDDELLSAPTELKPLASGESKGTGSQRVEEKSGSGLENDDEEVESPRRGVEMSPMRLEKSEMDAMDADMDEETELERSVTAMMEQTDTEEEGTTHFQAAINTFIAFVGAGILGLPNAFRTVGATAGVILTLLIGIISVHCMHMLLRAKHKAISSYNIKSYGDLAWIAGGKPAFVVIQASLLITQTGFCCAYLIFIMENIHSVVQALPSHFILGVALCAVLPLTLFRHLKYLVPFSLFANTSNLVALGVVYLSDFVAFSSPKEIKQFDPRGFTFFFGVAVYCYEGIGMVISLEDSMKEKKDFPKVLTWTTLLVTFIFISFGVCGYCAFGPDTKGIITLNLEEGFVSGMVKGGLCCGLLFTYPVMIFPVSQILDDLCLSPQMGMYHSKQNILRVMLVMLTAIVALSVPDFGLFISLVGSSCCSILAFIMPAYIHFSVCREEIGILSKAADVSLIIFGVFAAVVSTHQSIVDIRNEFGAS